MSILQKDTLGQKWLVYAWDITTDAAKTGDAANITGKISQDHGTLTAIGDTNPVELESGYYLFDLTQAETKGDVLTVVAVSATANIQVRAVPETQITMDLLATVIAGLAVAAQNVLGPYPGSKSLGGRQ